MSIFSGSNPLLTTITAAGGGAVYEIERSLRFNSADSAYLNRTPSAAGNRKTWTWAGWVKRSSSTSGNMQVLLAAGPDNDDFGLVFDTDDRLHMYEWDGSFTWQKKSDQVFRDFSAWYHIVAVLDTANATTEDRARLYVNGQRIVNWNANTNPSLDFATTEINDAQQHRIGQTTASANRYLNGYLADIHFIDGQALDPTSFGEFDANGVWQPIEYTGTYPGNSFHLPFSDNSTAAALGTDTSGAGNNWTVNNISLNTGNGSYAKDLSRYSANTSPFSTFDGDTNTGATQDLADGTGITYTPNPPIVVNSSFRFSHRTSAPSTKEYIINGGTPVTTPNAGWVTTSFTGTLNSFVIRDNRGVGYGASLDALEVDGTVLVDYAVGGKDNDSLVDSPTNYGTPDTGVGGEIRGNYCTWNPLIYRQGFANAAVYTNGNLDALFPNTTFGQRGFGSIFVTSGKWYVEVLVNTSNSSTQIGVANIDYSNNVTSVFRSYKSDGQFFNGTSSVSYGSSYTSGDLIGIAFDMDTGSLTFYKNGVSQGVASTDLVSLESISVAALGNSSVSLSLNAGQRPFAFPAPSGFKALCTTNLPEPTIADGSTAMDVALYTGNGSTQTISGLNFSPDLVWVKARSSVISHFLYDTVRGFSNGNALELRSNQTNAEGVPGVASTGLTAFNSDGFSLGSDGGANTSSATYVGWTWDAGSSTVTNTDGSITSQVRANASAGFSIVTYTGNLTSAGSATVGHGLNVAPELIISKSRTVTGADLGDWAIQHSALPATHILRFDTLASSAKSGLSAPTSIVFTTTYTVGLNVNSNNYVAYCFAPVDGYSSFGSYTGNGSADGPFVYTGFRPRWVLVKMSSGTSSWQLLDSARSDYNVMDDALFPNLSNAEIATSAYNTDFLSNGFKIRDADSFRNGSGSTFIYAAFAEHPFQFSRAR